jgi:hypothetical protein
MRGAALLTFVIAAEAAAPHKQQVTTSSTQLFVSELIRAANEVPELTREETVRLLQRAAATILDFREQLSPGNESATGMVNIEFELTVMAASIDLFSPEKISALLLEAAGVIKAARGAAAINA